MNDTKKKTQKATRPLDEMGEVLRGLIDEARVQAHLGAMEAKELRPYLDEVAEASKAAARDLVKRGKALKAQLARLRQQHEAR